MKLLVKLEKDADQLVINISPRHIQIEVIASKDFKAIDAFDEISRLLDGAYSVISTAADEDNEY